MERFLLLWDEMDDFAGVGRHFIVGAVSEAGTAAQLAVAQLVSWTAAVTLWVQLRRRH